MHLFRKLHFSMNKSFETYQTIDEVVHSRLWRSPEPSARALCPRLVPAPWASRLVPAPCACALCLRLEPGLNGSAGDCLIGSCFNGPWFCPGLNNKYATGAVTSRRSVVNMLKDLKWIDGRDGRGQSTTSLISRKKKTHSIGSGVVSNRLTLLNARDGCKRLPASSCWHSPSTYDDSKATAYTRFLPSVPPEDAGLVSLSNGAASTRLTSSGFTIRITMRQRSTTALNWASLNMSR